MRDIYKNGYTCRCWRCWGRRTLLRKPADYLHPQRCRACGTASLFVDWHRMRVEYARAPCDCHGYGFKHRRTSGWCIHNPKGKSDAEQDERYGVRPAPF